MILRYFSAFKAKTKKKQEKSAYLKSFGKESFQSK